MKREEVDIFEKVSSQLAALHEEISALSKKTPNDCVNLFKIKYINKTLVEANSQVKGKYKPYPDFETFDEEELPTNSDVTFILAQYLSCLEKYRADNIIEDSYGGTWSWIINGKNSGIPTAPPQKIKR